MKACGALIELLADLYWRFFAVKPVSTTDVKEAVADSVKGNSERLEGIIKRGVDR
jgi:hypothetical protein